MSIKQSFFASQTFGIDLKIFIASNVIEDLEEVEILNVLSISDGPFVVGIDGYQLKNIFPFTLCAIPMYLGMRSIKQRKYN